VDQHDGRTRPVILVVDPDVAGILPAYGDERHRGTPRGRPKRLSPTPLLSAGGRPAGIHNMTAHHKQRQALPVSLRRPCLLDEVAELVAPGNAEFGVGAVQM
jgi:hypothetical protein